MEQLINKADAVKIMTAFGLAVKITKVEARRWLGIMRETNRLHEVDPVFIDNGRGGGVLVLRESDE